MADAKDKVIAMLSSGMSRNDVSELVKERFNCRDADVDDDGLIWIENPHTGHWISDERIATFVAWVESK